jgi:hypothetical protein
MDDVQLDVRNMGVNEEKRRALERMKWDSVMRETKAKLKRL